MDPSLESSGREVREGDVMKIYFLALATVVVVCVGCVMDGNQTFDKGEYHAPPAALMARPGPMVDGPGPGVMPPMIPGPPPVAFATMSTQVKFLGPAGMHVGWRIRDGYAENQIVAPGRYNFRQGATYRLKLTGIPDRDGLVLYPSLQIFPTLPQTEAYLSHNNVPLEITNEDLEQVESNNFVTKVIYLPDAKYQELAIAGVSTLVSTQLDPGVDPVAEAERRGAIMAVLRMGNMDLEMPGRPAGGPVGAIAPMSLRLVDGEANEHEPPMPEQIHSPIFHGVPNAGIYANVSRPGAPGMHPVAGMGPIPNWGMPITGTPIGLPGPPHLPYGGPAGLKSHTVRNNTEMDLPKEVDHMLVDVKHEPGYRLPKPVRHIQYSEKHPVYRPGEASYPAWQQSAPGVGPGPGAYGPPPGPGGPGQFED